MWGPDRRDPGRGILRLRRRWRPCPPRGGQGPQGLVRYVPGQGRKCWCPTGTTGWTSAARLGLNAQGLYYIDGAENQLWRLDLTTGEEALLYEAPTLSPGRWDRQDRPLWETLLEDIHDTAYDAALFLDQVTEDTVTLTYRYTDGSTTDTLVLDSRTGDLRSKKPGTRRASGPNMWGPGHCGGPPHPGPGDRAKSGWTFGRKGPLLPAGTVAQAPPPTSRAGCWPGIRPRGGDRGGCLPPAPQAGAYTPCPPARPGEARTHLAAAQGWVLHRPAGGRLQDGPVGQEPDHRGGGSPAERCNITGLVTDGTWCYCTNGKTTDCYRLTGTARAGPLG